MSDGNVTLFRYLVHFMASKSTILSKMCQMNSLVSSMFSTLCWKSLYSPAVTLQRSHLCGLLRAEPSQNKPVSSALLFIPVQEQNSSLGFCSLSLLKGNGSEFWIIALPSAKWIDLAVDYGLKGT